MIYQFHFNKSYFYTKIYEQKNKNKYKNNGFMVITLLSDFTKVIQRYIKCPPKKQKKNKEKLKTKRKKKSIKLLCSIYVWTKVHIKNELVQ